MPRRERTVSSPSLEGVELDEEEELERLIEERAATRVAAILLEKEKEELERKREERLDLFETRLAHLETERKRQDVELSAFSKGYKLLSDGLEQLQKGQLTTKAKAVIATVSTASPITAWGAYELIAAILR